eukprot:scaffold24272_cov27-Tisochrysis_lutea.AAC.6
MLRWGLKSEGRLAIRLPTIRSVSRSTPVPRSAASTFIGSIPCDAAWRGCCRGGARNADERAKGRAPPSSSRRASRPSPSCSRATHQAWLAIPRSHRPIRRRCPAARAPFGLATAALAHTRLRRQMTLSACGWPADLPLDRRVHLRLCEHGLVNFVVAVLAVADNVDDDVALECLPPLGRKAAGTHDRLNVVAVHMENGRLTRTCGVTVSAGR